MVEYAARTGTLPAPLGSRGADTFLSVVVVGNDEPEPGQASRIRHRLGQLVYGELCYSYGL